MYRERYGPERREPREERQGGADLASFLLTGIVLVAMFLLFKWDNGVSILDAILR